MNVVVLNDCCHVNGGTSRVAIDEAVSLAALGHQVTFFGAAGPVCDELAVPNLRVICLSQPQLADAGRGPRVLLQGLWNTIAYKAVDQLLAGLDREHTIVHLHGYTKALTSSPVRAATRRGFRMVCTLHEFFLGCPNGAFFDYQENRPCQRRALSFDCVTANCDKRHYTHKLYRVTRQVMQRGPGNLPNGITNYITLSRRSVDLLRPYLPTAARYYPLENVVEVPHELPADVESNSHVVAIGRLDVEKGIDILLEATRRAKVSLTLVGDGPLRARAEMFPHCTVTGWLDRQRVLQELHRARALVFPSLWYETYGLSVTEAAACGVPAIVSDISAAAERVEHEISGWHVRTGDAGALARSLALTQDNVRVRALGRAAYDKFWAAPPTRQRHATQLLKIYDDVLAS